jgi:GxxExxY protein
MDAKVEEVANKVIGAAIEVHRHLGPGYLESVYEEAVAVELSLRDIAYTRQTVFGVDYKGHAVGMGRLDLLVDGCLPVELKAVEALAPIHIAQLLSYLKATKYRLSLLINFNVPVLKDGIKRVIL